MPAGPTFNSFPERPKPTTKSDSTWEQGGLQASTSLSNSAAPPTFSSFPERSVPKKQDTGTHKRREEDRHRRSRQASPGTLLERKRHRSDVHADTEERRRHRESRERSNRNENKSIKRDDRRSYKPEQKDEERRRKHRKSSAEAADTTKKNKETQAKEPAAKRNTDMVNELFYVDRSGDQGNVRYGGIEASKIARYIPGGLGRVVGLPEQYKIMRARNGTQGDPKGIVIANRAAHTGDHEPTLIDTIPQQTFKFAAGSRKHEAGVITEQHDFVALNKGTQKAAIRKVEQDYRSISGFVDTKGDKNREADEEGMSASDDADESEDLDEQETPEQTRRRRVLEFERNLEDNPQDIDKWIAFSSMQIEDYLPGRVKGALGLMDEADNIGNQTRVKGRRGAYEVALATLERAIEVSSRNAHSPKLQSAFFALAQQVWPPHQVTEKWQDVLRTLSSSGEKVDEKELMDLWLGYISWREGRGLGSHATRGKGSGGIDDVVEIYAQCIAMMRSSACSSHEKRAVAEENMVYLLLRCVLLLRHAGFHERGTAICQAMLELTFHKPLDLRTEVAQPLDTQWEERLMESLEAFWESEVPRIGENGSRGWSRWQRDTLPESESQPENSNDIASSIHSDPFIRWHDDETAADRQIRPGKASALSVAEEEEDDPYRVVLFDDIRSFLFVIHNAEVKLQLVYAVLNYLGLPFGVPDLGTNTTFSKDPHLQWSLSANPAARKSLWPPKPAAVRQVLDWSETQESAALPAVDIMSCPVKLWLLTSDTAFEDVFLWFSVNQAGIRDSLDAALLQNMFQSLSHDVKDRSFQWLRISFEASCNKKSTAKLCKQLLSQDRSNLTLWCTYARLLRSQRKVEEARQVYRLCCSTYDPLYQSRSDIEYALSEWAELEWLTGRQEELLNILIAVVSTDYQVPEGKPSPAMYLKAKQHYWQSPDLSNRASVVLHYLFLCVSMDFAKAFQAVQVHASSLPAGSSEQEEVLQLGAKIMYRHAQTDIVKADVQRDFLEYAISLFPSNTIFLSLYFSNESGTRVYGRLQRLLYETVLLDKDESAGSYLWSVWAEAMSARRTFWEDSGRGAERVRAMYEKAISSKTGRYSIPLWMSYVEFMFAQSRGEQGKRLCYRAISHLGGCKALYMMPFSQSLRSYFTDKELRDWADLMLEKGLRIRKSFEEYWQDETVQDTLGQDDGGDPMAADEAYSLFEDRKRLLPY
ncbi:hypothetical protein QFC22_005352 [Naganishia vaughanmartiniae]|uniref:Uncharacterized protein n=1 Tax=Naganishia vaughanmartiniae TaxID=1424756 RepID=A0ACC2WV76_9TREE|nr:hypothetical protein QFC22_005352 [Naganishia vaughanmartiniae]